MQRTVKARVLNGELEWTVNYNLRRRTSQRRHHHQTSHLKLQDSSHSAYEAQESRHLLGRDDTGAYSPLKLDKPLNQNQLLAYIPRILVAISRRHCNDLLWCSTNWLHARRFMDRQYAKGTVFLALAR